MAHWGWYWKVKKKHIPRTLCSKLITIDSFKIMHHKNVVGFGVEPMGFKAIRSDDHLVVTYGKRKTSSYNIPIDKQACTYGGFRYFFKCPLCNRRMRLLYFTQNSVFLCRKCLNLSYDTQRLRPMRRYDHASSKIKDAIKAKGGDADRYKKPPRMHETTFDLMRRKRMYYEDKAHQASNKELREWYGARAEPYLDEFFDYVDESKGWRKPCRTKEAAPGGS